MLTVADVKDDVQRVLGGCSDPEFYNRLNDIVEVLASESEWDPMRGYVDVAVGTDSLTITLPRGVGQVLAVNFDGLPSQAHDFWFNFHLNGPGEREADSPYRHWTEQLPAPIFRDPDPETGAKLALSFEDSGDVADTAVSVRVFGYDVNGNWIRSQESGVYVDGFLIPKNGTANGSAPNIAKISRVSKTTTRGYVTLSILNDDATTTAIGKYAPDEKEPRYRRIKLNVIARGAVATIGFRKADSKFSALTDLIPLHSRYAIILMAKALKKFDEDKIEEGDAYHGKAIQLLVKRQLAAEVPSGPSIQVADNNLIADHHDRMT